MLNILFLKQIQSCVFVPLFVLMS